MTASDVKQTGANILQHNIGFIAVAVLLFLFEYVFNDSQDDIKTTKIDVQKLTVQFATLNTQIAQLTHSVAQASGNRYTSVDAERDKEMYYMQLNELRNRIDTLEGKH